MQGRIPRLNILFSFVSLQTYNDTFFSTPLAFEANFMDDVGQTLLNWSSAFGTQEMVNKEKKHYFDFLHKGNGTSKNKLLLICKQVEFLCERGADVNRGQRSSSLHYAACFGRPQVAKVIFKYLSFLS